MIYDVYVPNAVDPRIQYIVPTVQSQWRDHASQCSYKGI